MHSEDIHLDSPEIQIKPENLEQVSTTTSAFKNVKNLTINEWMVDLLKTIESGDEFNIISTINEINLYLIQICEENTKDETSVMRSDVRVELPKMEDFLKTFALFMIPLHFTIFEFSDNSKLKYNFTSIIIQTIQDLIENSSNPKFNHKGFLDMLNKNILAKKKEYIIVEKVFSTLIKNRDEFPLIRIIKLTYENVLFDTIHGKRYTQKTQKCIIHKKPTSPRIPFLPEENVEIINTKYTLVLDLDETLIHSFKVYKGDTEDMYYLVRPGAFDLLNALSKYYEIVIFTAGTQSYANDILDSLDISGTFIAHRLFRQHISKNEKDDNKDITKLGRPIEKTIIVDNSPANFELHPNNGLYIKTWKDEIEDQQLYGLTNLLLHIAKVEFPDVREAIHIIRKELKDRDINALPDPYDEIDLKKVIRIVEMNHDGETTVAL